MELQIELIEPRARKRDPSTSHEAAKRASAFSTSHAGRILLALKQYGPRTAHELEGLIGLSVVQIDRRTCELQRLGLIRVAKLHDGADVVLDGFRVWEAV
jgi:predicted transcriptional regulator